MVTKTHDKNTLWGYTSRILGKEVIFKSRQFTHNMILPILPKHSRIGRSREKEGDTSTSYAGYRFQSPEEGQSNENLEITGSSNNHACTPLIGQRTLACRTHTQCNRDERWDSECYDAWWCSYSSIRALKRTVQYLASPPFYRLWRSLGGSTACSLWWSADHHVPPPTWKSEPMGWIRFRLTHRRSWSLFRGNESHLQWRGDIGATWSGIPFPWVCKNWSGDSIDWLDTW